MSSHYRIGAKLFNVCIVGCGEIAATHAKNLYGKANTWFFSRTLESAIRMNLKLKGAGVFQNYCDVLTDQNIQAVIICTPPKFHKEQAVAALENGKSVLVEKPMCLTLHEIDSIREAESRNQGAFLMVAENYIYKPSLKRILELIEKGDIGQIRNICMKIGYLERKGGWRDRYGALFECGIHFISQISAMMNNLKPEEVIAEFPNWTTGDPERTSIVRMKYPSGKSGELHFSWEQPSLPKGVFQLSWIEGYSGKTYFESNGIFICSGKGTKQRIIFPSFSDITGRKTMIADFINCLLDSKKKPEADLENAARNLDIVFRAYQSQNIPIKI